MPKPTGRVLACAFAALVSCAAGFPTAATTLDELIAGAKKETELRLTLFPRISPEVAKKLETAFNRRYGIDIRLTADLTGRYSTKAAQGVIEHRSSAAPLYDVMILPEAAFLALDAAGAIEPIPGWQKMLPPGADESVSPDPVAGRGFKSFDLYWGFSYNAQKIARAELPRTLAEAAEPRFAGRLAISNFATNWTYALMRYEPDDLLKIASGWGRNGAKMLHPTQMAQHVGLGEYAIGLFQTTEQALSAREKGAAIEVAFFRDVIPHGVLLHAARKGARSPNAAKLFTLWSTGREAVEISGEGTDLGSNLYAGNIAIDLALGLAREAGVKPVSFFDSPAAYEKLRWLETKEGQAFTRRLTDAIRGQ
jgi:ABC-type Fe3+ transport system substrate-binding protein